MAALRARGWSRGTAAFVGLLLLTIAAYLAIRHYGEQLSPPPPPPAGSAAHQPPSSSVLGAVLLWALGLIADMIARLNLRPSRARADFPPT